MLKSFAKLEQKYERTEGRYGPLLLRPKPEFMFSNIRIETAEEKAMKWKREFDDKKQVYAIIVGPVFDFLRLISRAPFYRDNTGRMKYKRFSSIMVYSVVMYILISTNALLSIIDIYRHIKPSFNDEINTLLSASMLIPQMIIPVLTWILMRRQQSYFNEWAAFQDNYEQVTRSSFPSLSTLTPSKLTLCAQYLLTAIVIAVLLPYFLRDDLEWYNAPSFYFSFIGNVLHFWYWTLTGNVISIVAKKFLVNFRSEVLKRNGYTPKIEEYRLLWLHLNRLIRECGSCNSYIVSIFILTNIFSLVVVTYNVAFAFSLYANSHHAVEFLDGLLLVCLWWLFIYAYCNAGFRMECALQGTLENVLLIKRSGAFDEELRMNFFLFMLRKCEPKATISDYYVVNRQLFGSIAASLFTYILVVKQFHLSKISMTNLPLLQNKTN